MVSEVRSFDRAINWNDYNFRSHQMQIRDRVYGDRLFEVEVNKNILKAQCTRRIKILESTAQTIYQEWFVKFRFSGYKQVKYQALTYAAWRKDIEIFSSA